MKLADLSDAQLLESLKSLCGQSRAVLARLLTHLVEVEERRLHLEAACPSMLLHGWRAAFPDLLAQIERGDLTLSTIALLHDTLTEANYEELVEAAAGKTKAEVQALLAKRFPTPDIPASITVIPTQSPIPTLGGVAVTAPAASVGPQLSPLSETRHRVQFTASDELRRKLERAQDLMRHANADGDLAVVLERAVDLLLEKLEKQRLGKTSRPRSSPEQSDTARVLRATRRTVFERDGERCTFTDAEGHRCPATNWLELDHVIPRAVGGTSDAGNLRVRCRAHNALYAEQTFGKEHVARKIRERRDPRQRGYASQSCDRAANGARSWHAPSTGPPAMQLFRGNPGQDGTRTSRANRVWHRTMAHALAVLVVTGGYGLSTPRAAWAQTVVPNVDLHVDAPRPVELLGRADGSKGWASICRSPCDLPVPLTWTYAVQSDDSTRSSTFRLAPGDEAHLVVRPESSARIAGGVLVAILGGLVATSGYVLMQLGSQRMDCPGTDPGCNTAPHAAYTAPGTLMVITGLVAMVVGGAFAIDGSMTHVSQVQ